VVGGIIVIGGVVAEKPQPLRQTAEHTISEQPQRPVIHRAWRNRWLLVRL
jgi:hypothetical protein